MGKKIRIIEVMKIMQRETDEQHPITVKQIIDKLQEIGITADRRSIYSDLKAIEDQMDYEIVSSRGRQAGYYLVRQDFELPELKLMVDSIQCAKFVTAKKSEELIHKMEKLTSRYQAGNLRRQVQINGRVKTDNERIFYNVDTIYEALNQNRRILFQYFDYDRNKRTIMRRNGAFYDALPYYLVWDDNKYYLVTFSVHHSTMTHYRVDRMTNISLGELQAIPALDDRCAAYMKSHFGMFSGEQQRVQLAFRERKVNQIFDKFGLNTEINQTHRPDMYYCEVDVAISNPFFGWIAQYEGDIRVVSPRAVAEAYREFLRNNLKLSESIRI